MKIIRGVLLGGVVAMVASHAAKADSDADEIRLLKAQLKKLEQRVDTQSRKNFETQAKLASVANPLVAYKASAFDCPAGKICAKGVTFTFGGWIDLTGIYRSRELASDTGSVYNAIPLAQNRAFGAQEQRFSARQSRFSVQADADYNPDTHITGYGEIDFEGAAQTASSNTTNSFNPRMRQASVEIDRTDLGFHVLAGQSWSLTAPSKAGIDARGVDAPGVIDFESVPGFLAERQPGIRVWQDIGPEFKVALSAENAATTYFGGNTPAVGTPATGPQGVLNPNLLVSVTGPGGSFFNSLNNVTLNRIPDITAKAAWDPMLGANKFHVEGWVLYRDFYDRFNFANHAVDTASFGGHIALEAIPKTLDLSVSGAYGTLGRLTATPFPDVTVRQDGSIQTLPITSFYVGAVWHTTPSLDLYSYAGLEKTKATFSDVGSVPFGYGNPLYDNRGCNVENSAAATCNGNTSEVRQVTVGAYDTVMKGSFGAVKVGAEYSYTQRFTFAGVGGAPKTDDHIVMTQVRYYPF
jgi:hypothetical protein